IGSHWRWPHCSLSAPSRARPKASYGVQMFLHSVSATDSRFKRIEFRTGLNILVASRTEGSEPGDSRNSTGKSSLIRVIRYLLGGDRSGALDRTETAEHSYRCALQF